MIQAANRIEKKAATTWLMDQARHARGWIALSVGLGAGNGFLLVVQATCIAQIIHGAAISARSGREMASLFIGLAASVLGRAVLGWIREEAGFRAGAAVREAVRSSVLGRLIGSGQAILDGGRTGALAAVAMEQVEALHNFYAQYLPQMILAVIVPLTILAFVFPVSWAAGGLLMFSAPLIPLFMFLVGMGAESISQRHFQTLGRMSAHFLDTLQGLPTLKLFYRSREEAGTISRVSREFRRRTMAVLRMAFISSAVLEFFSALSIALTAVFLGMRYLHHVDFGTYGEPLTLAGGLFILLLAPDFYLPLRELGAHYHARAEAIGASAAILAILDPPLPNLGRGEMEGSTQDPLRIECQDLHATYDRGRRKALAGVDLLLVPGEKTALVGESGAGKTTLLHLLLGFMAPDRGEIRINGRDLREFSRESWHRRIAWIGQHPILFYGTVRENIRMGRPEASDAEIEDAARAARVLEFTDRMPAGLDTPVGERGHGLSRGQVQRIALARAFLKDAPLVLLDEPTAGLDRENERLVMEGVGLLTRERTLLMATHRLATLKEADRILVLAEGRIVEAGTYGELTSRGGAFDRFVKKQIAGANHG